MFSEQCDAKAFQAIRRSLDNSGMALKSMFNFGPGQIRVHYSGPAREHHGTSPVPGTSPGRAGGP